MLKVDVMGEDKHIFTISIDSVLEAPQKGASIVCGKCQKKTKVFKVGIPYREDNGENYPTDSGQATLFK